MLTKLRTLASLYREIGPRWMLFRLAYAFRLRTGLLRWQMPVGEWSDYKNHITTNPAGRVEAAFFRSVSRPDLTNAPWNPQTAIDEANKILNGELKYFSHKFIKTGFPPNWHTDYFGNVILSAGASSSKGEGSLPGESEILRSQKPLPQNDMHKHWSQIPDDYVVARRTKSDEAIPHDEETALAKTESASQRHVDIKFVWEPNRFAFAYSLVRAYAATRDEKYPEAFWTLIEDWAKHNPPNTGPNWMDGQEISLRLMAWIFGYHAFLHSPSSTPERLDRFKLYIAAQAERIYRNRSFAVSSHNNHCITEAVALWMVGLLFPELKNAEKYRLFGHASLESEAREQIFPDGTYSMYSLNYHRFVLHIYLYALQLAKLNNISFSDDLKKRITTSMEYLSNIINPDTGEMPVYGSNDGALVLPLNNCDFTDYRPLLQLGWYITKGGRLLEPGPWDEDIYWICGEALTVKSANGARKDERRKNLEVLRALGGQSFPNGGIYLLRGTDSHALIRCTDFTARPSHADQLHVDLWMRGHNLAIDAGTYLYSSEDIWRNGLARTSVHNTVTVDNKDQMTLLSRFTWTNWSKGKVLQHEKNLWQGEHDSYKPVSHKRTVMALEGDRWLVIDKLKARESHHYALQWLLGDFLFEQKDNSVLLSLDGMKYTVQVGATEGSGGFSLVRADPNSTRGWRSRYYGHKEPAISIMLEAARPQVTFWTFFGFEGDVVEAGRKSLRINSETIQL